MFVFATTAPLRTKLYLDFFLLYIHVYTVAPLRTKLYLDFFPFYTTMYTHRCSSTYKTLLGYFFLLMKQFSEFLTRTKILHLFIQNTYKLCKNEVDLVNISSTSHIKPTIHLLVLKWRLWFSFFFFVWLFFIFVFILSVFVLFVPFLFLNFYFP